MFSAREYSYYKEYECPVRYIAIKAVSGQRVADEFAEEHLDNEMIRTLHFDHMLLQKNYERAEQLCREIIAQNMPSRNSASQWDARLLDVYQKSGNHPMLKRFLHDLFFQGHKAAYYDQLKAILIADGEWKNGYYPFLEQVKGALDASSYAYPRKGKGSGRCSWRSSKKPDYVYSLLNVSSRIIQEIFSLCVRKIILRASESSDRNGYRRIGDDIKKLYGFGGQQEALNAVTTLKQNYPRCPSLKEELDNIAATQMVQGTKHRNK